MFKIDLNGATPQWHDFPENSTDKNCNCRLKIQRYPASKSQMVVRRTEEQTFDVVISGLEKRDAFCECLIAAEDLQDLNGKPIDLNEKITVISKLGDKKITIKQYIYDYEFESGIPVFVLKKAGLLKMEVEGEEKNLGNGQNGSGENLN